MLNYKRYKAMFDMMDDKAFSKWASEMGHELDNTIELYQLPFEEMRMPQIKSAADFLGIPLEEYVWYRHTDNGAPIRSRMKCPVGYVPIKRMQQLLSKKNKYATENEKTNLKTGQVIGDSKVSSITDPESFFLSSIGADEALKELLGPRADHMNKKSEMYRLISRDGYVSLNDLPDDLNESSTTLNTINTYMIASGIRSDLLSTSLKTPFTLKQEKFKKI